MIFINIFYCFAIINSWLPGIDLSDPDFWINLITVIQCIESIPSGKNRSKKMMFSEEKPKKSE